MKNNKGEIAFTTIVEIIIVAVVLIAVIVWFLPAFSGTAGKTEDIKDSAGVTDTAIQELTCKRLCNELKDDMDEPGFILETADFCEEKCCVSPDNCLENCEGIYCGI
jgi:hypothetical protein